MLDAAPGEPDVERWRAIDEGSGEHVELLVPASRSAAARAAFESLHGQLQRAAPTPGLVRTRAMVHHGGRPVAVRAALDGRTLGDLEPGLLSTEAVASIGASLIPAVVAAGGATLGALTPRDIGIDAQGQAVIAPLGRPRTRIGPADTRFAAPEAFAGARPDGAAGLYGLGVCLYELLAGQPPSANPPAPPSAVRRGIDDGADAAITTLLGKDPASRAGALAQMAERAGAPPDLRALPTRARLHADPGGVRVTTTQARPAFPRGVALVEGAVLAELDPAARSALAGAAGLPVDAIDNAASRRVGLVVAELASRAAARERAAALTRELGLPVKAWTPSASCLGLAAMVSGVPLLLATSIGLAVLGLGTGVFAWVAIIALVLGAGVGVGGAAALFQNRAAAATATAALQATRKAHAPWDQDADGRRVLTRIGSLRGTVARLDLPATAASDLRGALRDIEQRLDTLREVAEITTSTLAEVDLDGMRARVAAFGARRTEERDRLARTVSDLEAVAARRRALHADYRRLEGVLDEVAATLARHDADRGDTDGLLRSARSLQDAAQRPGQAPLPREQPSAATAATAARTADPAARERT